MALISVKRNKRKRDKGCEVASSDAEKYPYGTRINLDNETLTKLGIKTLPEVGTVMRFAGIGPVTSVSENESVHGKDRDVSIQLERIEVKPNKKPTAEDAVSEAIKDA